MKTFNVNYLLTISRLPDHFYGMVNGMTGRDTDYKNPGVALRSYLVAKCLRRETVQLSGDVLECAQECEDFSYSGEVLSKIMSRLEDRSYELIEQLLSLPPNKHFVKINKDLTELTHGMKLAHDSFIMSQDPTKDHFNLFSSQSTMLREVLFDLEEMLSDVEYNLSTMKL